MFDLLYASDATVEKMNAHRAVIQFVDHLLKGGEVARLATEERSATTSPATDDGWMGYDSDHKEEPTRN